MSCILHAVTIDGDHEVSQMQFFLLELYTNTQFKNSLYVLRQQRLL